MGFKLFNLGLQNWKDTQLIYHALAELDTESLVIQQTRENYICLGMFNSAKELNFDYLKRKNIPVFRREIGGGTVWLDRAQIFYHLIIKRDNPLCPVKNETFFTRFLQPVVDTYKSFGIDASIKPACDIVAEGKKISGNGAGTIEDCKVLSGSILLEFNPETFIEALSFPDERFRKAALEQMTSKVASLSHFGIRIEEQEIRDRLIHNFSELLGDMERVEVDTRLRKTMKSLEAEKFDEEWLLETGKDRYWREIKIAEECYLFHFLRDGTQVFGRRGDNKLEEIEIIHNGSREEKLESLLLKEQLSSGKILNMIKSYIPDKSEEIFRAIKGG
ncbi:MAG TPA: lipoate--protein ligase family protein [Euryarchaeota archaeon]|nr:lipoate-protein ligase LplJ [archaeon BMS3Bbin15]HDL15252.1 lipoate--protein ligase family protein [Euryarchaeota archaeon]